MTLSMDTDDGPPVARGIIFAPLAELHPDRIVIRDQVIFLGGVKCPYAVGTLLKVHYWEQNGRRDAERITAVPK